MGFGCSDVLSLFDCRLRAKTQATITPTIKSRATVPPTIPPINAILSPDVCEAGIAMVAVAGPIVEEAPVGAPALVLVVEEAVVYKTVCCSDSGGIVSI